MSFEDVPIGSNQIEPRDETSGYAYIYGIGLASGMLVTPELLKRINETQDRLAIEKEDRQDKDKRPPKPPSRPNARIGRTALGFS